MYIRAITHARKLTLALSTLLLTSVAHADETDFDKPISIKSASQSLDGKTKTSILTGDVRIEQGSLLIRADEVEIIATEGEGNEIFIARGAPTSYQQTMEDGSQVEASAMRIEYQVNGRKLSLIGDAQFSQNNSNVSGDSIIFDMDAEQLMAEGGDGRVTTVFQPGDKDEPEQEQQEP